jgi:hypothetical protein
MILMAYAVNVERRRTSRRGIQSLFKNPINLLLFLPGFQNKGIKIPAHLESFQEDLSLRFIEFFDLRFQLVASVHEILQFAGRDHHGVLGLGTDVVELLPPILLRISKPAL